MIQRYKGIIFDMDNTILRSNIDFKAMKHETFRYLVSTGIFPNDLNLEQHTTATLIKAALETNRMTSEMIDEMWEIPKQFEVAGMENAELESGVLELLTRLQGRYCLAVVTNNSDAAAETALRENQIWNYFDCVVGREKMGVLKPAPDGFHYLLNRFKSIRAEEWLSVGDAWIDGKASVEAGIPFVAYNGDIAKMTSMGVYPIAHIQDIREIIQVLDA